MNLYLIEIVGDQSLSKSLYRSHTGKHFYGTEYDIWAGFGLVGNTEKKVWVDYEKSLRAVFHILMAKKTLDFFFKYCTKNLHRIKLINPNKK